MRLTSKFFVITSIAASAFGIDAVAEHCPRWNGSSFDPALTTTISFEKKSKNYTYGYNLANNANSKSPIEQFSIEISEKPRTISDPKVASWEHRVQKSYANLNSDLIWNTRYSSERISVPLNAIQPGTAITGFIMTSPRPPGPAQYHLQGYEERTVLYEDGTYQRPDNTCTNIDMLGPTDRREVTGMTVGPAAPTTVQLKLRLRKKESSERFIAFDSKITDGEVSLLILNDPSFIKDPLVLSSLKFGADEASVIASKEIDEKFSNSKVDERAEWELQREKLFGKEIISDSKNLMLNFKIKDLGVKCGLDKSLFLSGVTKSGKKVFGGVDIKILGCDVGKPGIRKILNDRYEPNC
jgi:hypothetical protein